MDAIAENPDEDEDGDEAGQVIEDPLLKQYNDSEEKIKKETERDIQKWTKIINSLDKTGDGKVTFEEFKDGLMKFFD